LVGALDAGLVALLYALEPALITDTVRSPRALGVVALTVVACMLLGRLGRRWQGSVGGAIGAAVPLALVGWLVIAPAVRGVTLIEPLPAGASALDETSGTDPSIEPGADGSPTASAPALTTSAPTAQESARTSAVSPPASGGRQSTSAQQGAPSAVRSSTPRSSSPATAPSNNPTAAPTSAAPAPPPASGPVEVSSGRVEGINHTASGTVAIYRLEDGSHIVRFEDVALEGAPDPVLWLVPGRDRRSRDGGLEVGPLKATHGSFNHAVPASFDVTQDFTVFIWCERYATPIANATQNRV